jgi:hypothetical protein
MDKFFSNIGLEEQELKNSKIRGYLYIGMIFMLGIIVSFLTMALLS